VLDCVVCGVPAHYVGGLGVRAGRWAHAAPAAARYAEAREVIDRSQRVGEVTTEASLG
jgi:hypothetical protein